MVDDYFDWSNPPRRLWASRPKRLFAVILVAAVATGVIVGVLIAIFRQDHSTSENHHHTSWLSAAGLLVFAGFMMTAFVAQRRALRAAGLTFWPDYAGFPRPALRELSRSVRDGRPSADPDRRRYEIQVARRAAIDWRSTPLIAAGLVVFGAGRAADSSMSGFWRWFLASLALLFVSVLPLSYRNALRSRRFLDCSTQLAASENEDRN